MRKDYISQWYEVREDEGVSDRIHVCLYDKHLDSYQWQHFRHRDTDGIGMITQVKKSLGYSPGPVPVCRDKQEPGFWEVFRRIRRLPKNKLEKKILWKDVQQPEAAQELEPIICVINQNELENIKKAANHQNVSVSSLTLACLNQSLFRHCLKSDSHAWWFYPVNVRGAVNGPVESNLSSGFYLPLDANSTAKDVHRQVKQKLSASEHWWLWKLAHIGRWIGKSGVRFIYQYISRRQFYIGSFSYLGDWSLPDHPQLLLSVCGAGSKNYPVSTGITECNGQLTLALKFHPSVPGAKETMQKTLTTWRQLLLAETSCHADISQ
jgi:hypothetical protein